MGRAALVGASLLLAAVFLLHYFPFVQVRENSMSPTLKPGALLLLSRLSYTFGTVRAGDVLVFTNKDGQMLIKRCVLTPGTPLQWRNSKLYIPYLKTYIQVYTEASQSLTGLKNLPAVAIFVLGDNAAHSVDSRHYGLVPVAQIQGKALWY